MEINVNDLATLLYNQKMLVETTLPPGKEMKYKWEIDDENIWFVAFNPTTKKRIAVGFPHKANLSGEE